MWVRFRSRWTLLSFVQRVCLQRYTVYVPGDPEERFRHVVSSQHVNSSAPLVMFISRTELWLSRQGDIPSTVTQHDRTAFTCAAPAIPDLTTWHNWRCHTTHPKRRRRLPHLPTTPLPRQTTALSLIRQYKMIFLLFLRCCYDFLSVYAFVTKYLFTYEYPRRQSVS